MNAVEPNGTTIEACPALDHVHHEGSNYYASCVRDSGKDTALLAGPYSTHGEALEAVPAVKRAADKVDPRAHWYAYGTVAMPADFTKPGKLNDLLGKVVRNAL